MSEEFTMLKEKADNGDKYAQFKIGELYEEGVGVSQNYAKAFEYYLKASKKGLDEATNNIGLFYQSGLGVEQDYKKAAFFFEVASNNGFKYANNNLGFLYLNGLGVKRNYIEAYNRLKDTSKNNKYLIDILEKIINGKKIVYLNNISEFNDDCLDDDDIVVLKTTNGVNYNDYYTVKSIKLILNVINEIIHDININDSEINRFLKIYIRLSKYLSYDKNAYNSNNEYNKYILENASVSRNLIGLLTCKCVCEGYSDILLNILACIGIESRKLTSYDHSFNKVKINGKWYYCDLTLDCKKIYEGYFDYCLLSKEDFETDFSHISFDDNIGLDENSKKSFPINEKIKKELINVK